MEEEEDEEDEEEEDDEDEEEEDAKEEKERSPLHCESLAATVISSHQEGRQDADSGLLHDIWRHAYQYEDAVVGATTGEERREASKILFWSRSVSAFA